MSEVGSSTISPCSSRMSPMYLVPVWFRNNYLVCGNEVDFQLSETAFFWDDSEVGRVVQHVRQTHHLLERLFTQWLLGRWSRARAGPRTGRPPVATESTRWFRNSGPECPLLWSICWRTSSCPTCKYILRRNSPLLSVFLVS